MTNWRDVKVPTFTKAETDAQWDKEFHTIEALVQKEYDEIWNACFSDIPRWCVFAWYLRYLRLLVMLTRRFPRSRFLSLWHADYLGAVRNRPEYKSREKRFQSLVTHREDFASAKATFKSRLASRNIPGRG